MSKDALHIYLHTHPDMRRLCASKAPHVNPTMRRLCTSAAALFEMPVLRLPAPVFPAASRDSSDGQFGNRLKHAFESPYLSEHT